MANPAIAERERSSTTPVEKASLKAGRGRFVPRVFARVREALEPNYDWGAYGWERLDGRGEGEGRHVQLEWFGLKLSIVIGRRPPIGLQRR